MNRKACLALSTLAAGFLCVTPFCVTPAHAENSANQAKVSQFLNKITKVNKEQEALAGQVISKASNNLPLKTYANTVNWDDKANQEAVNKLAAEKNIQLTPNAEVPQAKTGLMSMAGSQFATSYIDAEVKDQTKALDSYKKAEREFQGDPHLEMYIKESIPMVEGHVKTAKLLQQHMQQKTAANSQ